MILLLGSTHANGTMINALLGSMGHLIEYHRYLRLLICHAWR